MIECPNCNEYYSIAKLKPKWHQLLKRMLGFKYYRCRACSCAFEVNDANPGGSRRALEKGFRPSKGKSFRG